MNMNEATTVVGGERLGWVQISSFMFGWVTKPTVQRTLH